MSNDEIIEKYQKFLQLERNFKFDKAQTDLAAVQVFLTWCELEQIKIVAAE